MSQVKLTADSGGGTTSLKGPSATTGNADVVLKLPVADGSSGQVLKTDGSGQLSFTSNAGTTINNNADNRVITGSGTANTLNGESNVVIDSSGNVGIGTTSPESLLSVDGSVAISSNGVAVTPSGYDLKIRSNTSKLGVHTDNASGTPTLEFGTGGATGCFITNLDNTPMRFGTQNTERMRIDGSGRVMIGTSTEGYSGGDDLTIATSADTGITIRTGTTSQGILAFSDGTSGADEYRGYVQYQHQNDVLAFGSNAVQRMTIDSSGNVGIGTTSPARHMHLNGSDSDTVQLHITNSTTGTTGSDGVSFALGSDESLIINQRESNHIALKTADTERMRIHNSAYVSFGTTSTNPTDGGSVLEGEFGHLILSRSGTGSETMIRFNRGGSTRGSIAVSTSTTYNTSSDYRLKENVTNLTDALTRLKKVTPRRFNFIDDKDKKLIDGFIAHEVSIAVPEAVTGTKDQVELADDNEKGIKKGDPIYQQLDYSKFVPLLTAALQEEVAKREALEARVAALEAA